MVIDPVAMKWGPAFFMGFPAAWFETLPNGRRIVRVPDEYVDRRPFMLQPTRPAAKPEVQE
jgi:hypothetical protein